MQRFEGKTVIITGSGRGIGKEIALRFAKEKANVVLSSNEALVNDTCKQFKDMGYEASSFEADVVDKSNVRELFDFAEKKYGEVNIKDLLGLYEDKSEVSNEKNNESWKKYILKKIKNN